MALKEYIFLPAEENVKVLGRTVMLNDCRLLYLSGSGVEFEFEGNKLGLSFFGDSSTEVPDSQPQPWNNQARIAVFVDDEMQMDIMITRPFQKVVVFEEEAAAKHVVRIIKLSEPRMSGVGLGEITVMANEKPVPTKKAEKSIEIIGDSITCGYGVDANDELEHFYTGSENVSKAYSYLTAKALEADYSFISYSGHGFISGYTANPEVPLLTELIQPYYEIFAYSFNTFRGKAPEEYRWDFKNQPDVVIINIGTNDESYVNKDEAKALKYEDAYVEFLKTVHRNNPEAKIVCAYGVMGDFLYPYQVSAAERFKKETGFTEIFNCPLAVQDFERNGYGADYHPSKASHIEAAKALTEYLKNGLF